MTQKTKVEYPPLPDDNYVKRNSVDARVSDAAHARELKWQLFLHTWQGVMANQGVPSEAWFSMMIGAVCKLTNQAFDEFQRKCV